MMVKSMEQSHLFQRQQEVEEKLITGQDMPIL